ncbi:MAG: hypothetical protein WCX63_05375 [Methanoregula sp.]
MKNFRPLIFFYLISCAGLLWAAFLLRDSDWFFPGISMIGLILLTNVIVLILWLKSQPSFFMIRST